MKKLLFITFFLTSVIWCNAQTTDTLKVVTRMDTSGVFVIDTLKSGWYELSLSGGDASAVKRIYVSGSTIKRNLNDATFTGLIGGSWDVVVQNNIVVVRVVGTSKRISWKLTRINL